MHKKKQGQEEKDDGKMEDEYAPSAQDLQLEEMEDGGNKDNEYEGTVGNSYQLSHGQKHLHLDRLPESPEPSETETQVTRPVVSGKEPRIVRPISTTGCVLSAYSGTAGHSDILENSTTTETISQQQQQQQVTGKTFPTQSGATIQQSSQQFDVSQKQTRRTKQISQKEDS